MYTPIKLTEPVSEQDDSYTGIWGWHFVSWIVSDTGMSSCDLVRWIVKNLILPIVATVIVWKIYPLALFPLMLFCAVFCTCCPFANTMLWVSIFLLMWGGWTATNKPLTLTWGGMKEG